MKKKKKNWNKHVLSHLITTPLHFHNNITVFSLSTVAPEVVKHGYSQRPRSSGTFTPSCRLWLTTCYHDRKIFSRFGHVRLTVSTQN